MNTLSRLVLILVATTIFQRLSAQNYQTDRLEKAVVAVGLRTFASTLVSDQTAETTALDGQLVCMRTNQQGEIEHVGIPLFNADMRALMPSPVYDFMEYALLNWKYKVNPNTLYLSKVIFKKGSWNTLLKERLDKCECNISNQDNRLYILSWSRDGREIVVIGIPIEYELLNNDTRRNMERDFIRHLASHKTSQKLSQSKVVTEKDLKIYGTEGLFVVQGQSHILAELNQNIYYKLTTVYESVDTIIKGVTETMTLEEVVPAIVVDEEHPIESFANLMMAEAGALPDATMNLDFHLSDYHRQTLSIQLSQLRDYFKKQGCNVYFACSGLDKQIVKGMLFVHNAAKGYNHLFSLRLPINQISSEQPTVQAAVYLYIPPIDKSHLFGKTPTKKSGAKIYQ